MGQANSRQRTTQRQASAQELPRNPTIADSSSSQAESPTQDAQNTKKKGKRAAIRRSILGLVPSSASSSSSSRSRTDSVASEHEPSQSLRKRWRSSRRFSQAPTPLSNLPEAAQQASTLGGDRESAGSGSSATAVSSGTPSQLQPSHASASTTASRSPTPWIASPEEERLPEPANGYASPANLSSHSSNPIVGESGGPASTYPTTEDIRREVAEFLTGQAEPSRTPGSENVASATPAESASTSTSAAHTQHGIPQAFPPPGTLVVVQGVVNTTDTPHALPSQTPTSPTNPPLAMPTSRPSFHSPPQAPPMRRRASSVSTPHGIARSEERHAGRSRLSSFIRPGRGSESSLHAHTMSSPEADLRSYIDSDSSSPTTDNSPSSSVETQNSTLSDQASHPRGLSPGSIDVLGTLLSVAAAATAASLFSPGLNLSNPNSPISSNPSSSPPSPQASVRPLSPTPTAGLGALGGLGGLSGLGLNSNPTPAPQDSRDRIRNVWESIRERVGLNSRNSGSSDRPTEDGSGTTTPGGSNPRMRPGEMMLAEMARALNAGLGLANSTPNSSGERRPEATSPAHVLFPPIADSTNSLPPEGSFERFLANLQNDLRTILSEEPAVVAPPDLNVSTESPPRSSNAEEPTQEHAQERVASRPPTPIPSSETDHGEEHADDNDGPPPLASDSDSDSDESFHDADGTGSGDESADHHTITDHPIRTPTPIPNQDQAMHTEAAGQRRRERPAINLWRIYRFDPIPASHAQGQATASPQPSSSSIAAGHNTGPGATTSGPSSPIRATSETNRPSSPVSLLTDSPTAGTYANVVVPVIVVGLQSVDVIDQDELEDDAPHTHAGPSLPADLAGPPEDGASRPTTPRGRRWPSRAANALRTWRPGRRGSRAGRNADGSGSRTFLIYVIGGYYPPNHHMVTGSDNLDSYEALWELAELLGQVKPPTATREDIDKSGLQIVKASELPRLEEEGRVASNCVERCLVCLDDYEPDNELRLMSCRHAFHKDCVDKWLQVGRNNCPACRTKGVSVPGDLPPSSPDPAPA